MGPLPHINIEWNDCYEDLLGPSLFASRFVLVNRILLRYGRMTTVWNPQVSKVWIYLSGASSCDVVILSKHEDV